MKQAESVTWATAPRIPAFPIKYGLPCLRRQTKCMWTGFSELEESQNLLECEQCQRAHFSPDASLFQRKKRGSNGNQFVSDTLKTTSIESWSSQIDTVWIAGASPVYHLLLWLQRTSPVDLETFQVTLGAPFYSQPLTWSLNRQVGRSTKHCRNETWTPVRSSCTKIM